MSIRYTQKAIEDLHQYFAHVAALSKARAEHELIELKKRFETLKMNPFEGTYCCKASLKLEGYSLLFKNSLIFYQVLNDDLLICRVIHSGQNYVTFLK